MYEALGFTGVILEVADTTRDAGAEKLLVLTLLRAAASQTPGGSTELPRR